MSQLQLHTEYRSKTQVGEEKSTLDGIIDLLNHKGFTLNVTPKPTPRPRARAIKKGNKYIATVYNPTEYTNYKKSLSIMLRLLNIKGSDYQTLNVIFYLPYPKSTPKYKLIEGAIHQKKPDWDNYVKGLQDAMEECGILKNDGCIHTGFVSKRYTINPEGRIEFTLT